MTTGHAESASQVGKCPQELGQTSDGGQRRSPAACPPPAEGGRGRGSRASGRFYSPRAQSSLHPLGLSPQPRPPARAWRTAR